MECPRQFNSDTCGDGVRTGSIIVLVIALGLLWPWGAMATSLGQERKVPQKIEPGTCLNAKCHGELAKGAAVHEPVSNKECDICHEQDDEEIHEFVYIDKGTELCYGCHSDQTKKKKFTHPPLKDKNRPCLACHDPHAGGPGLIKASSTAQLCIQCHKYMSSEGQSHQSGKAKGCVSCHDSHASDSPKYLRQPLPGLCLTCHEDLKESMTAGGVVHGPVAGGCVTCHDPHQIRSGKALKAKSPELCMTCHEHFNESLSAMSTRHPMLLTGDGCQRCHQPHVGQRRNLLSKVSQDLCLSCHSKDIKTASGRTIPSRTYLTDKDVHRHGPLASSNCARCHEPHGNGGFRFLRKAYPSTFYSPYSTEAYGLCFSCHDSALVTAAKTSGATNFRDGDLNLHYVHVKKPQKGRTCRVCHDAHASENVYLIRDSIQFGEWKLPIDFDKTDDGGTCAAGCHAVKTYSRAGKAASEADADAPAAKKSGKSAQ